MRRASRQAWCEAPRPHFHSYPGVGGWGAAPLARSTPTRAQRRDTPKSKIILKLNIIPVRLKFLSFILFKKG
ncbi:MAG: hypothetical protein NZ455_15505 [Bacteroidia bacterium]|nr:hypothetical protein [Bacteroidia bacterium]